MRNDTNDAIFYIYGMCEPDPGGFGCFGVIMYWKGIARYKMDSELYSSPYNTTEAATYNGILQLFNHLIRNRYTGIVEIRLSHQKVINQIMKGEDIRSIRSRNLRAEVKKVIPKFTDVIFCWVPLAENSDAERVALDHFNKYNPVMQKEEAPHE
jgi:ribonuclease HI